MKLEIAKINLGTNEALRVTPDGQFIWHPEADAMMEKADFSPAMRHILRALRKGLAAPAQPVKPVMPVPWHHRILKDQPDSDPQYWSDSLRLVYVMRELEEYRLAFPNPLAAPVQVNSYAADGQTELHTLPGVGLVVSAVAFNNLATTPRAPAPVQEPTQAIIQRLRKDHHTWYMHGIGKQTESAITATNQALALDKMAENARDLGLDYEPVALEEQRKLPENAARLIIEAWIKKTYGDGYSYHLSDQDEGTSWAWWIDSHPFEDPDAATGFDGGTSWIDFEGKISDYSSIPDEFNTRMQTTAPAAAQQEVTVPDDMSHAGQIKIKIAPDGDLNIIETGKDSWTGNDCTVAIELTASGGREGAKWYKIFRDVMLAAAPEAPAHPAPTGKAPCARHCESTAFQITIRGLKGEIERMKAAQQEVTVPDLTHDAWDEWQDKHQLILECEAIDDLRSMLSAARPTPCTWTQSRDPSMPDTFYATCGVVWTFTEGGPAENGMVFCPGCARKVTKGGSA